MFNSRFNSQFLKLMNSEKQFFTLQGTQGQSPLASYLNTLDSYLKQHDFKFSLDTENEQLLQLALLASDWMLQRITLMTTRETNGYAYRLGDNTIHTGRKLEGRYQKRVRTKGTQFTLIPTDTYFNLPYDEMAILANANPTDKRLSIMMSELLHRLVALDMLRIGFNGKVIAGETDSEACPNGEDVNIGWHQLAKLEDKSNQVLTDTITLGQGGDFAHIDALANHLIETKLPKELRYDPSLVVMVGADLAAHHRLNLFNPYYTPADLSGAQMLTDRVAGRFAFTPAFMPSKRLVVTTFDNLHIYTQADSGRLSGGFVDESSSYETGYLRNEGYALGDVKMYAAADEEAITLLE